MPGWLCPAATPDQLPRQQVPHCGRQRLPLADGAARELIAARARAGLSQADLAERMHTSQSAVARMESGKTLPSLSRYAEATGCKAVVRLEAQCPFTPGRHLMQEITKYRLGRK
ncbi:helix-turn-helix transcriptional regulator [Magnetovirga frankeli]|nr:helix-turn-helix transcriptional regulator [gamma proteobacterium SS-5]